MGDPRTWGDNLDSLLEIVFGHERKSKPLNHGIALACFVEESLADMIR